MNSDLSSMSSGKSMWKGKGRGNGATWEKWAEESRRRARRCKDGAFRWSARKADGEGVSGSGVRLWVTRWLEGASGSCERVTLIPDILNRIKCARIDCD